jgi:cold shock CspA family protein
MEASKVIGVVGRIKVWYPVRGFGFIETVSELGIRRTYFCHASALRPDSAEPIIGYKATFKPGQSQKGHVAVDVTIHHPVEIPASGLAMLSGIEGAL